MGNAVHCCTSATNRQCWLSCTHCCRCCSGMLVAVSDASLPSRCVPLTFTPFIHSSAHDCCHCQLSSLLPRLLLCCFLRLSRYFIHQLFCCLTAGAPGPPAAVASAVLQVLLIHRSAAVVLYSLFSILTLLPDCRAPPTQAFCFTAVLTLLYFRYVLFTLTYVIQSPFIFNICSTLPTS